jgi:hypothetical protein
VRKVGELDVEMLVIGVRSRSKVSKLILGSTARTCCSGSHTRCWRSRQAVGNPVVAGDAGTGPMKRVTLLDLDGCVVDSSEFILGSLNGALVAAGLEPITERT